MPAWTLTGGYEECANYCCNPDNDGKGEWCDTVQGAGSDWGYCEPEMIQV